VFPDGQDWPFGYWPLSTVEALTGVIFCIASCAARPPGACGLRLTEVNADHSAEP